MKRNIYIQSIYQKSFIVLCLLLFASDAVFSQWVVYDARVLPDEHDPVFDESNVSGAGATNQLVPDPGKPGNSFLELITAENSDNFMWRTPLQPETPGLTFVFRVKAGNNVARRLVEFDIHHNGIRERLYINREANRVRLNEGIGGGDGGEIEAPDGVDLNNWNIYRLTKSEGVIKLYLNEESVPVADGTTSTSTSNQYFRFGDGNGSHNSAALIDWIIWDESGAYAPGEGTPIPEELLPEDTVQPAWFVYDASVTPDENNPSFGTSGLAGAGMVSALVTDPISPENSLLQLLTLTNADNGTWRHVYPAQVSDITIVMRVKSANEDGRRVLELDMDNGGFRERLYLNQEDNLIRLQHSEGFGVNNEFPLPGGASVKDWNIYRMTKDAEGNVALYVNEDTEPLATGKTGQTTNNNHFRFGDTNGSHNISALIDWVIWDTSGIYAPGEGQPIPDGLITETPSEPMAHNWRVYDGRNLPTDQIPTFDESNVGGAGGNNQIIPDPDDENNGFLELYTAVNADNFMWRTPLQQETTGITIVMKVKAANDEARRVVELDLHHNGIRERLYINREANRVRLHEGIGGGDGGEIEAPEGIDLNDWNIYRLTKSEGAIKLYLNEDPVPLAEGTSSTSTTNQYFRFGDGNGSHNIAALLDWIIWDETGAYAPGEGSEIPSPVVTPNWDASLAQLMVDQLPVEGFSPEVTEYDVALMSETTALPVVSAIVNHRGAAMEIKQIQELPGEATVAVTAENKFTVITYTINIRMASADATLADLLIGNNTIEGFDPDTTEYAIELAQGTTEVPDVMAITNDEHASVEIVPAAQLPGVTRIVVTAENGVTKEYAISFTLDPTSTYPADIKAFKIYPNPAISAITIQRISGETEAEIRIVSISGQVLIYSKLTNIIQTIDVSQLNQGIYILLYIAEDTEHRQLLIKQ